MRQASFSGILHLPTHNLQLPLRRSHYELTQRRDHRGRPASKVRFGSFLVEVAADQAQLTDLAALAVSPHTVVDGYAAFERADGQGTFVTVWFEQACLHSFTEYFDATGGQGTEPSWVVQMAFSPERMGRENGSPGSYIAPAPGEHGASRNSFGETALDDSFASEPTSRNPLNLPADAPGASSPFAAAAAALFPGRQLYGNCGVQACQQIIHKLTGNNIPEKELLKFALDGGFALRSPNPAIHGETNALSRQALLEAQGIASAVIDNPSYEQISDALRQNKGIIAGINADVLWGKEPPALGGHAVLLTHGEFDESGKLTHVFVNDTGASNSDLRTGRRVSSDMVMHAFESHVNKFGENVSSVNVTTSPLWP